jgi:hypothetical protein
MREMMRLIKRVEELKASENPGDPMELCTEVVDPILLTPNYHGRLLDGISHEQWSLVGPKTKKSSRTDLYGKKGSKGNPLRGSRSSTPVNRTTLPTSIVAPLALTAPVSNAPGSSLDYSTETSAHSGDSLQRPKYLNPSSAVQQLSTLADNLHPELPRTKSLVNINQPIPPPHPMQGLEVPPTPPVSVITAPGENL